MPTPAELLAPHAHRTIRAFMRAPDRGNHSDSKVFDAFFALIYGATVVDHSTALAVEHELDDCDRKVQEVLDGWRPSALMLPVAGERLPSGYSAERFEKLLDDHIALNNNEDNNA